MNVIFQGNSIASGVLYEKVSYVFAREWVNNSTELLDTGATLQFVGQWRAGTDFSTANHISTTCCLSTVVDIFFVFCQGVIA